MANRPPIDLRSDTVTKPSEGMRRAMAEAEVDDDVLSGDPTTIRLQQAAARMLGKEAAILMPSATMANLVALKAHTLPGQEVICSDSAHIIHYEGASMAWVAGLLPRPITAPEGYITAAQVEAAIRPDTFYTPSTGLIELENPMNDPGGRIFPQNHVDDICDLAHSRDLLVHLDGARIFNAAIVAGTDVKRLARNCDSVCFCLSKNLGAPAGTLLLGPRTFIEQARSLRQALGGGMRQTGILAAAGLYALEHNIERLAEDHANARLLAEGLARIKGIRLDLKTVQTNMVYFDPTGTGMSADECVQCLQERGVLAQTSGPALIRFVTHLDVDREDMLRTLKIVEETVGAS